MNHRVLVIGTGSIGERHVRCFIATGRAQVVLAEINETLRTTVMRRYGLAEGYADFRKALAAGVDCAVIATPAPFHIPMATHLATSGVSMLIEKPLSLDMDGIEQLYEIVRARTLVAAVGYVLRANPPLKAMRDAIRRGRFGQPREIIAVSGQHFPTYRPAYRDTYYARRGSGGGAIQDAFTHIINLGEWLVGPISRLVADASHQVLQDVEVEDTVHVLARHQRVLGCYSLNQFQTPNENSITVVCDKGTVRWEGHFNRWEWQTSEVENWQRQESGPFERDQLFITQAHQFLDAMEGRSDPLCTLDEGVQTLRTNLAILASVEQTSWQELTAICCGGNHAGA